MRARCRLVSVIACAVLVAVCGEPAQTLEHHGEIPDPNRCPPPIEEHRMRFSLWTEAEGGELLWEEYQPAVDVRGGRYSVQLGASTPLDLDPAGLWLETQVDGILAGSRALMKAVAAQVQIEGTLAAGAVELQSPYGEMSLFTFQGAMYLRNNSGGPIFLDTVESQPGVPKGRLKVANTGLVSIPTGSDAAPDAGVVGVNGFLVLGKEDGYNMVLDRDEIMARNNGATSPLYLNHDGGAVWAHTIEITSDARLKKDVADLEPGLAEVLKLHPVAFSWTKHDDRRHLGLIAQEVQEVVDEVVSADGEGMLGISYQSLIPVLIKAIQEQQAEIDELRGELNALRGHASTE